MRKIRFTEHQIIAVLKPDELSKMYAARPLFPKPATTTGRRNIAGWKPLISIEAVDRYGPGFISLALPEWAEKQGVMLEFVRPGKSTLNEAREITNRGQNEYNS